MKKYTDCYNRFSLEEDWAFLEYEGIVFNVPRALLPDDVPRKGM